MATHKPIIDPPGFIIHNTTIAVDYWPRNGKNIVTHYFLTHAHNDHVKGLDETWKHGIINCTSVRYIIQFIF